MEHIKGVIFLVVVGPLGQPMYFFSQEFYPNFLLPFPSEIIFSHLRPLFLEAELNAGVMN